MKKVTKLHMQGEKLLGVSLSEETLSFKEKQGDCGVFFEIYFGDECIDDYLQTDDINAAMVRQAIDYDLTVTEGGGYYWGKNFWQLPKEVQKEILKQAGF